MRVLLLGTGSVGEAIALVAHNRPWLESLVLADYNLERARTVQARLGPPEAFPIEQVDAGDTARIVQLARQHRANLIMNAVSNIYNDSVFDAAFEAGCGYIDMAMSGTGVDMGSYQFSQAARWQQKGLLALLCMGMDPGVSDVFAKYAEKHLFDDIDEIGIRDGANLTLQGYTFAPTFSVIDTVEECTDLPLIWERERGWYTAEPFSEPELFHFPEGIGPLKCINIEHEEVVLVPRWIKCRRVTFKYSLDDEFLSVIKAIKTLGLESDVPVDVKGVRVAPRDLLAALLPDPADLGDKMKGKTCVGTWVKGTKHGKPRQVFLYQSTDNAFSMGRYGCQAIGLQTGIGPVIAMELLATGVWHGQGVLGPEAFDPDPFLARMSAFDLPYGIVEMGNDT